MFPLSPKRAASLHQAHTLRYGGFADQLWFTQTGVVGANPRTPSVPPLPPGPRPPRRTPIVTPPTERVPSRIKVKRPPAWARAYYRLGYGPLPSSQAEFTALGSTDVARYEALVDQQLAWSAIDDSAMETRLTAAGYTTLAKPLNQLWADHVVNPIDYNDRMRPAFEVQRSALARATYSKRQLLERMTTFWHDHFNVQATDYDAGPVYVHYHRDVIRKNALGNFRVMLEDMAKSTSMMYYLDNRSNTRSGPNENFARELLELHTFGAENYLGFVSPSDVPPCPEDPSFPIGYTDLDVYETASCFTGWSVNTGTGGDGTFLYRANNHDSGPKYVLGRYILPEQPPLKDGQDVLDRVSAHPRVAKFICKKIIRHFASDAPPQSLIDSAAAIFLANRTNEFQLRLVLAHILKSAFVRDDWGNKQRRPIETTVAAFRGTGSDWTVRIGNNRSNDLVYLHQLAGHAPYDWPAPNGYPDVALSWSGSNTFAMTWRMLGWLTESNDAGTRLLPIVETSLSAVPQWTAKALVDFWCNRLLGFLPADHRYQKLLAFMAQNGDPNTFVIANTNEWKGSDLKAHYNHDRLRNMVALILYSPEFFYR